MSKKYLYCHSGRAESIRDLRVINKGRLLFDEKISFELIFFATKLAICINLYKFASDTMFDCGILVNEF